MKAARRLSTYARPRYAIVLAAILILILSCLLLLWRRSAPTVNTAGSAGQNLSSTAAPQIRTTKDLNTALQVINRNDPTVTDNNDLQQISEQSQSF